MPLYWCVGACATLYNKWYSAFWKTESCQSVFSPPPLPSQQEDKCIWTSMYECLHWGISIAKFIFLHLRANTLSLCPLSPDCQHEIGNIHQGYRIGQQAQCSQETTTDNWLTGNPPYYSSRLFFSSLSSLHSYTMLFPFLFPLLSHFHGTPSFLLLFYSLHILSSSSHRLSHVLSDAGVPCPVGGDARRHQTVRRRPVCRPPP